MTGSQSYVILWMVSKSCSTRWLKSWNPMNHGINRQLVQDFATIHCGKHHPRSRRGSNFSNLKLTGAKRREWMGCWGLLGSFLIVIMMIMDHSRKFPTFTRKMEVPLNSNEESHSHPHETAPVWLPVIGSTIFHGQVIAGPAGPAGWWKIPPEKNGFIS